MLSCPVKSQAVAHGKEGSVMAQQACRLLKRRAGPGVAREEMPSSPGLWEKESGSILKGNEGELGDWGPDVSGDQGEGGTMAILPPQADLPRNRKGLPGGEGQAEGQEGRGLRKAKACGLCLEFTGPCLLSLNSQRAQLTLWGVTFPGSASFTSAALSLLRTLTWGLPRPPRAWVMHAE